MSFPNVSDIITTSIEQRSGTIADNVSASNALLTWMKKGGNIKPFSGGRLIYEEIAFAANANGGWYSGYDLLPVSAQDVITAAEFAIKQLAVPVVVSGLEMLQNSGKEQVIDLIDGRLGVAEDTMANLITTGLYSDGTGYGGKQIVGLDLAVPATPTSGTYGGIDRATWSFWQSQYLTQTTTLANVQTQLNTLWARCVRGNDRPNLILMGSTFWGFYVASLQALQRFQMAGEKEANLGFQSIKFMDADCVLDTSSGVTATNAYMLNTKFLKFRPHKDRNMVALSPEKRYSINQDAAVQILAFAGALTCSGAKFQGRITGA